MSRIRGSTLDDDVPSAAAQRDIPPKMVFWPPNGPEDWTQGAILPIDKPKGVSSFDVVEEVREVSGVQKVGHAGTLDPMATGLLIVLVSRPATRLQEACVQLTKTYEATLRMGERTRSHDAETEVVERVDPSGLTRRDLEDVRTRFVGIIDQVPPMYSAVRVDGERLYKKARRGETVERDPRRVTVTSFEITEWASPDLSIRVTCSKGTYVRALARDLGEELNVGAHLVWLRRTEIGPWHVSESWTLDELKQVAA